MNQGSPFSPVVLIGGAVLAVSALLISILFMFNPEHGAINTLGPGAHSRSAIGYAGLAETLKKLGVQVEISNGNSVKKAGSGVLFVGEPELDWEGATSMSELEDAGKVILVLPKWYWTKKYDRSGWIGLATPRPVSTPQRVLQRVVQKAEVVRVPAPQTWKINELRREPILMGDVQLVKGAGLSPVVGNEQGMLIASVDAGDNVIWIVADPDVLSNHALGADGKRNAVFAVSMVETLRDGSGAVVFDETVHGFLSHALPPWRMLFKFPYFLIGLQLIAAAALLLWGGMGRFGAAQMAPEPVKAGKQGLVENAAGLIEYAGYHRHMVYRYVQAVIRDTAKQVHAPKALSEVDQLKWLERTGKSRGVRHDCNAILQRAANLASARSNDMAAYVWVARDIYRWKQEMMDGHSKHPRTY
jgi:hypothetical protein